MNAALWFWEQRNETMTIRVDCLAGERKPYMTGDDATKYGFDACMYALGVLPPNYPVPAIEHAVFAHSDMRGHKVLIVSHGRCGDDDDLVFIRELPPYYPVPALRELIMLEEMWLQFCSNFDADAIYY
jgi:hypothetical protein